MLIHGPRLIALGGGPALEPRDAPHQVRAWRAPDSGAGLASLAQDLSDISSGMQKFLVVASISLFFLANEELIPDRS